MEHKTKRRWKRKLRVCLGGCVYKTGPKKGQPKKFRTTKDVRKCKNCRRHVDMDLEYDEYKVHR